MTQDTSREWITANEKEAASFPNGVSFMKLRSQITVMPLVSLVSHEPDPPSGHEHR